MSCGWVGWCALDHAAQAAWVQALLSFLGIVIAVGVGHWQSILSRRMERAKVTPYLQFDRVLHMTEGTLALTVTNSGMGPAILTGFDVELDGKVPAASKGNLWLDVLSQLKFTGTGGGFRPSSGFAIGAGRSFEIFHIKFYPTLDTTADSVHDELNRLDVRITYTSIFNDPAPPLKLEKSR